MKKITIKIILGFVSATLLLFTSCMEDAIQTNTVTQDELDSSLKAKEAMLWGLPAYANRARLFTSDDIDYDWGYGSIMHIRDVMGEDMVIPASGYDWYSSWSENKNIGTGYLSSQYIWTYLYRYVLTCNNIIGAIDANEADETLLGYLGAGYTYRAFVYLDIARMYEFLENDGTNHINAAGNSVLNLTAPIVTEALEETESRNNPRVTREDMFQFILSDLKLAEQYIVNLKRPRKTLPDLAVVYGLMARLYMWKEDYPNAKIYANKAISESGATPTTKEQWLNTASGFNDISTPSWMWGATYSKEDKAVTEEYINWTSWMCNEATFGYAYAGPTVKINRRTYERIDDKDFRKLSWKGPEGSPLNDEIEYLDPKVGEKLPEYASLKFRPGSGNTTTATVGSVCSYPLMRVEEMYFIAIEAEAQTAPAAGLTLLTNFMKEYRNKEYKFESTNKDEIIEEIIFQKRIELWGEGLNFFDYKRLNLPVTRGYSGTNFDGVKRLNTTTRPAWMNFCIVEYEPSDNPGMLGFENPDPSGVYAPWSE